MKASKHQTVELQTPMKQSMQVKVVFLCFTI